MLQQIQTKFSDRNIFKHCFFHQSKSMRCLHLSTKIVYFKIKYGKWISQNARLLFISSIDLSIPSKIDNRIFQFQTNFFNNIRRSGRQIELNVSKCPYVNVVYISFNHVYCRRDKTEKNPFGFVLMRFSCAKIAF